jgi:hypothetical protein
MAECSEKVKIFRQSKKTFTVNLRRDDDPLDLTTNDEITVCLPGESAVQTLTKTGGEVTILNAALGKIQVDVPAAKSALLKVGEDQTIEIQVVDVPAADPEILQIEESLDVIDSIC